MTKRPVLIVGGGGFIGRALAADLCNNGWTVCVLARHPPALPVPGVDYHIGDQSDADLLRPLMECGPDIIHVACATTPGSSARDPRLEVHENVLPIAGFLHALQGQPTPGQLIFVSSGGTVYGAPTILPIGEAHPLRPLSYHGAGKVTAEVLLEAFAYQFGWGLTVLRPSNVYGPGQSRRPDFGVIPAMLAHAQAGSTMTVWGDGSVVRDFLFVDDLTSACRIVLEQRTTGIFNVGSGRGTSIRALAELVCVVTQRGFPLAFRPARRVDVQSIILDVTRLRNETGWQPMVTLEEGLRRTWEWQCRG